MTEQPIVLVDMQGRQIPLAGTQVVFGRSSESNVRLNDDLASRRHFALLRIPSGWALQDLGSSNGTFLNGRRLRPDELLPLAPSDTIKAGQTTFVAQLAQVRSVAGMQPLATPLPAASRPPAESSRGKSAPVWYWATVALVLGAIVALAIGAFLPWLRVEVELSLQNLPAGDLLGQLLGTAEEAIQSATGKAPLPKANTIEIQGMEAYGGLMLLTAGIAALAAILDVSMRWRRSRVSGLVYVAIALLPLVMLLTEFRRFAQLANQQILFGVDLLKIVQGASEIIQPKVTPLSGLYLTGIGLVLLLVVGFMRTFVSLISRAA
jgi:pSer/pThr/pTyr-binding forkhead associated (FHA) protein